MACRETRTKPVAPENQVTELKTLEIKLWSDTEVTQKPIKQRVAGIMEIMLFLKYFNLCLG